MSGDALDPVTAWHMMEEQITHDVKKYWPSSNYDLQVCVNESDIKHKLRQKEIKRKFKMRPKSKTLSKKSSANNNDDEQKCKTNLPNNDLIKCPNCGELIKKDAYLCENCNSHLKDGKLNTKRNV